MEPDKFDPSGITGQDKHTEVKETQTSEASEDPNETINSTSTKVSFQPDTAETSESHSSTEVSQRDALLSTNTAAGKAKVKSGKSASKKPLIALAIFFLAVLIFAVATLVHMFIGYASARKQYAQINETYVNMVPEIVFAAPDSSAPVYSEVSPVSVDFDGLKAACPDIQGWLYSEETIISYPVVQADDNDIYLHNAMDGSYSYGGTLFVDCICEPDFQGKNTIIYGHNMNDGSMFASLLKYREQSYYDEHPIMYLNTPGQNYKVEIFAGYTTPADSDTYTYSFADDATFEAYVEKMAEQSDFDSGILPATGDRIITLSTCCYDYDEARYVIQGVLVPVG